jgi:hypothetical protein
MPAPSSASSSIDARVGYLARRLDRIENRATLTERPAGMCARLAACHALGAINHDGWAVVARRHFSDDALLMKAASSPAMSGVPGWAQELVAPLVQDVAASLLGETALSQLRRLAGLSYEFGEGGIVRVPSHQPVPSGGFAAEGDPIPVAQLVLSAATLGPLKAAALIGMTDELLAASPLNLEQTFRAVLAEDLGLSIDSVLLGSAVATAAAPAGLLAGATVVAPGASLAEDVAALIDAVAPAFRPVLIASAGTAAAVSVLAPGLTVPVIVSPLLAADALAAVDASAFVSALGPPVFSVSNEPALHFETSPLPISTPGSPPTIAAPVLSAWQAALTCLRTIIEANWALRRPNAVAILSGPAWRSIRGTAPQADAAEGQHLPAASPLRRARS